MGYLKKYIPGILTRKDYKLQKSMLNRSVKNYKKGKYYTRIPVNSFKSKKSPHVVKAQRVYNIDKIIASSELSRKSGCKKAGLVKIIQKGKGAYYSSGSRPNQTAHSWGRARLASAITGGKSSMIDYHILEKYCNKNSKAIRFANKLRKKTKKQKTKNKKQKTNK